MIIGAVIGGGLSLFGALKGQSEAKKQRKAQGAMHDQQMALARDQMGFARGHYDFGQGQYNQWQQQFNPVLGEMMQEAMANRDPDYAAISSDVTGAFDSARGQQQRQMERYGINPGDGMWGANNRQYGIGAATAEVGARQQARQSAGAQRYSQLANLYGVGTQLMGQAAGMMGQGVGASSAATGMGIGAAGQAAGAAGQQAAMAGQQAGNNWASFGQHLMSGIDSWQNRSTGPLGPGGSFAMPGMPGMNLPGLPGQSPIRINGGG